MEKHKRKLKIENPWKLAFFILFGILVGALSFLFLRVSQERESSELLQKANIESYDPTFQVQLTKNQTNQLINFYINEIQSNSSVEYKFILENQALLSGTFELLGHGINFYIYFEPYVLTNGDIQLKAKSISVGTLSLPISELMNYVKNVYDLPTWVEVDASNEIITLHLNQFKLKNGMFVKAEQIDLIDDIIQINVYLPTEN